MDTTEFELKTLRAEIMNKLDWTIKIELSIYAAVSVILSYLLSANPDNISWYSF